ncbi:14615_t:CDS:1, partial [Dentiscutata heterogama]
KGDKKWKRSGKRRDQDPVKEKHSLDERRNSRKYTFGSNELDKREINEVVKDCKWMLKIETQFEFKEEKKSK